MRLMIAILTSFALFTILKRTLEPNEDEYLVIVACGTGFFLIGMLLGSWGKRDSRKNKF